MDIKLFYVILAMHSVTHMYDTKYNMLTFSHHIRIIMPRTTLMQGLLRSQTAPKLGCGVDNYI